MTARPFIGAKIAVFFGPVVPVMLRDRTESIPWPGYWDFPGGGAEPGETPETCVLRELREELGLCLTARDLRWRRSYRSPTGGTGWFFAARLAPVRVREIRLGAEGERWALFTPRAYIGHAWAIPHFRRRLRDAARASGQL